VTRWFWVLPGLLIRVREERADEHLPAPVGQAPGLVHGNRDEPADSSSVEHDVGALHERAPSDLASVFHDAGVRANATRDEPLHTTSVTREERPERLPAIFAARKRAHDTTRSSGTMAAGSPRRRDSER
jgi:hypothetical protein